LLDAGHYGKYNRSTAVKVYYESDFTFKFCNLLKGKPEGLSENDRRFYPGGLEAGY